MSTRVEIEAAIEALPADELAKLARWLEDYQVMIGAAEALDKRYDDEERNAGKARILDGA